MWRTPYDYFLLEQKWCQRRSKSFFQNLASGLSCWTVSVPPPINIFAVYRKPTRTPIINTRLWPNKNICHLESIGGDGYQQARDMKNSALCCLLLCIEQKSDNQQNLIRRWALGVSAGDFRTKDSGKQRYKGSLRLSRNHQRQPPPTISPYCQPGCFMNLCRETV